MDIYERAVRALNAGSDTVLAVCAGSYDALTLKAAGVANVTISNLETGCLACEGCPATTADVEALPFADKSFDWVTVHAGLHHCMSPHRGLMEMLRVARQGVVVVESRDSFVMRTAVALGLVPAYEIDSVVLSGYVSGGMRHGPTPNYVYRWTEREVEKLVATAYPDRAPSIAYLYATALPTQRYEMFSMPRRWISLVLGNAVKVLGFIAPRQCNRFAFIIRHGGTRHAWINEAGTMRRDMPLGFDPTKYWRNRQRC